MLPPLYIFRRLASGNRKKTHCQHRIISYVEKTLHGGSHHVQEIQYSSAAPQHLKMTIPDSGKGTRQRHLRSTLVWQHAACGVEPAADDPDWPDAWRRRVMKAEDGDVVYPYVSPGKPAARSRCARWSAVTLRSVVGGWNDPAGGAVSALPGDRREWNGAVSAKRGGRPWNYPSRTSPAMTFESRVMPWNVITAAGGRAFSKDRRGNWRSLQPSPTKKKRSRRERFFQD